ncbi:MAG: DUF1566 domain-containing protein [Candidatus Kuenenia sp.]|nr:DUF1566 domain-containing protein [Candidatus Kuenenia hertensis]
MKMKKRSRLIMTLFLFVFGCAFPVSECKAQFIKQETGKTAPFTHLRSSYRNVSLSQAHSMENVFIRKKDEWGFYGHSTIRHDYEKKSLNGDYVVIDHATGLMWHQSGSSDYVSWNSAKDWIRNLNNRGYAGYQDWRLPTLEEAVSLLEPNKTNNLYIDPVFDDKQWGIWSGDIYGSGGVWSVYFSLGNTRWRVKNRFVRPVRSFN